jgi:hypothetical protein
MRNEKKQKRVGAESKAVYSGYRVVSVNKGYVVKHASGSKNK